MTRVALIQAAWRDKTRPDEEFSHGFRIWTGMRLGYEFGPYFKRTWELAITLKCIVCILLGLAEDSDDFDWACDVGHVEVAAWDGDEHNGYPEANYHEWSYLKVRFGWRPRTWHCNYGRESSA